MHQARLALLAAAGLSLALSACNEQPASTTKEADSGAPAAAPAVDKDDPLASAMAAAPAGPACRTIRKRLGMTRCAWMLTG